MVPRSVPICLLVVLLAGAFGAAPAAPAAELSDSEPTLLIIPHIHWEGAVFKTREEYLDMGLNYILEALKLLKEHPEYRFVLDQTAYVRPFIERYPEQAEDFKRFVSEGRLELTGATKTMMDVNMPSGESYVRHVLYGKRYYRKTFGVDVSVGWGLDTFGHHAQMPQLLKLAGYDSYWFQRGPDPQDPFAFRWKGIDGTTIPAIWLAQTYVDFYNAPGNMLEFNRYAHSRYKNLEPYTDAPVRISMAGTDVAPPKAHLPAMVEKFNEQEDPSLQLRFAVPSDYVDVVKKRDLKTLSKELNPVFQGIYSSRIEVKQWMRELERLLTSVEKFAAMASWLGEPTDEAALEDAWDWVLFNQAHDLISGVMVDKVFEDTKRGYQYSEAVAKRLMDRYLEALTSRIDTSGEGIPVAVFNTLAWDRKDYVEVMAGFSEAGIVDVEVRDASGAVVPSQLVEPRGVPWDREPSYQLHPDGTLKEAHVGFLADVPAMGYAVYRIFPKTESEAGEGALPLEPSVFANRTSHGDYGTIDTDLYKISFNLWTGEMVQLVHKPTGWEVLGGRPGNVVVKEYDGGDFWELEGNLDGGRLVAMQKKQRLPARDRAQFSSEQVGGGGHISHGPVFSQFSVRHPFGNGRFSTNVRVFRGMRRIEFATGLVNNDEFVRYRVLFPTTIRGGLHFHEIPFGALMRPTEQELPAQNWIDYSGGGKGLALLNRGLPGNNVASDTLTLSLARSARIQAYAFHGGYEPGVGSDSGLEVGKSFTFQYALVPHSGDWRAGRVYRDGLEFNNPLIARKLAPHEGSLPSSWSMLDVSEPNVVVSAVKPGEDGGVVVRLYEAAGRETGAVDIRLKTGLESAELVNLVEDPLEELEVSSDTVSLDFGPFEVKTLKLSLKQP